MATHDDVRRIALALPDTQEADDGFGFSVLNKGKPKQFVWLWRERVHPKKARVPNPDVIVVRVADLAEKDYLLASDANKFFTEPHYDGYAAVLIRLASVTIHDLDELILDSWRCVAPPPLTDETGGP